ncbi:MAG TPA: ParB/RepB/Spo0J family partition protein, partial [Phycisphaerales bacterium]|nr:ParB/RepB/Spo0J family partition protein [Phycisphaerales bacterium]
GVGGVMRIGVGEVMPNRFQPRREMEPERLRELAESIKSAGVMQPIVVRRLDAGVALREVGRGGGSQAEIASRAAGLKWELIAGERRWRACTMLGMESIPAIVADVDDRTAAEWAVIENVQRADLGPMERAWAFHNLAEKFGLTQEEIAERTGVDRSSISNFVRLIELEEEIQKFLNKGALSAGHAKVLLGLPTARMRLEAADLAQAQQWSVRQLERWANARMGGIGKKSAPAPMLEAVGGSATIEELEKQLSDHLGTRVRIKADSTRTKGKMVIEFYNIEHFDGLMERMGFEMRS